MVGITLGTGVGGVIALERRDPSRSRRVSGRARPPIDRTRWPRCSCGGRGCLEAFVNSDRICEQCGTATVAEAVERARAGDAQSKRRDHGRRPLPGDRHRKHRRRVHARPGRDRRRHRGLARSVPRTRSGSSYATGYTSRRWSRSRSSLPSSASGREPSAQPSTAPRPPSGGAWPRTSARCRRARACVAAGHDRQVALAELWRGVPRRRPTCPTWSRGTPSPGSRRRTQCGPAREFVTSGNGGISALALSRSTSAGLIAITADVSPRLACRPVVGPKNSADSSAVMPSQ